MKRALIAALVLVSQLLTPPSMAMDETQYQARTLRDCSINANIPCIEKIVVSNDKLKNIQAKLTGATTPPSSDQGIPVVIYDEYSVDGFAFEGDSGNHFIPRFFFYPYDPAKCNATTECTDLSDYLQIVVQPSWINGSTPSMTRPTLQLPHRPSPLLCGTSTQREVCYRAWNFNQELKFDVVLHLPEAFTIGSATGTIKSLTLKQTITPGAGFKTLDFSFVTIPTQTDLFSDAYASPLDAISSSPYADFAMDWPNFWLRGNKGREGADLGSCRSTPFVSVLTNAIYQDIPRWNSATEIVEVKLWAPHFKDNGDLNYGFYEAKISKELAKCLWGIDVSGRTSAQISVVYADSTEVKNVATVVTSFDGSDLSVIANNFTYSNPIVGLKLVQQKEEVKPTPSPTPTPSATATPTPSAPPVAKKITITCVKGKTVKKVTAVKPVCPKGYKKK